MAGTLEIYNLSPVFSLEIYILSPVFWEERVLAPILEAWPKAQAHRATVQARL